MMCNKSSWLFGSVRYTINGGKFVSEIYNVQLIVAIIWQQPQFTWAIAVHGLSQTGAPKVTRETPELEKFQNTQNPNWNSNAEQSKSENGGEANRRERN